MIQFPNINTYSCVGTAERVSGTSSWQLRWVLAMPGNRLLLAKVCMEQYIYCCPSWHCLLACALASYRAVVHSFKYCSKLRHQKSFTSVCQGICLPFWEQSRDWRNDSVLSTWLQITSLRVNKSNTSQIWVPPKCKPWPSWLPFVKGAPQLSCSVGDILRPFPKHCTKSSLALRSRKISKITLWCPDLRFPASCVPWTSESRTWRTDKCSRFWRDKITS